MSTARRTFLALWPERAVCEAIAARTKAALPGEVAVCGAHELHVTLVFLGAVEDQRAPELDRRIAPLAAAFARPQLELRGTGAFPERGRERVLWLGVVERGAPRLAQLQRELAAACAELGFVREERPWSAHVTLARVRRERPATIPARFYELDFQLSWQPAGVARVVSQPGAGESERYRSEALHPFRPG